MGHIIWNLCTLGKGSISDSEEIPNHYPELAVENKMILEVLRKQQKASRLRQGYHLLIT